MGRLGIAATLVLAAACAPAVDWRQMQPQAWGVTLALPCRPSLAERRLVLVGREVNMAMLSCAASEHLFAVSTADVADPALLGPALAALREAARANLQGRVRHEAAAAVKGMTPQPQAKRQQLDGRRPDGQAVAMDTVVFAHGTRVYQASVLGMVVDDGLANTFFQSLAVKP